MPDGKTNFFSAFLNYMQPNMIYYLITYFDKQ